MTGEERRQEIVNAIMLAGQPLSGSDLAARYQVSRQVIVQDIALLRAAGYDILSTTRGYMMHGRPKVKRVITVCHTDEQIAEELNTIVDMGGRVLDVFVHHEVYGDLRTPLSISSRRHVTEFLERLASGQSRTLKSLTCGLHSHTLEADSEETLDLIVKELKAKGYFDKAPAEVTEKTV